MWPNLDRLTAPIFQILSANEYVEYKEMLIPHRSSFSATYTVPKPNYIHGLFISVMRTALNNFDRISLYPIYKSIAIINSPAPVR